MFSIPKFLERTSNKVARSILNTYSRNVHYLTIDGTKEKIYQKKDFTESILKTNIKNKQIGVIGYGTQGRSQSLNLKDNNFNVIIGTREGNSYKKAEEDGWVKDSNLFSIEEVAKRSDIIFYLLSDAGQINSWQSIYPYLTQNKTLYFSHGFGVVYKDQTNIIPPHNIDVILVAPKGAGISVREKFLNNQGINVSVAVHNDHSGAAKDTALALADGIGGDTAFETTFQKEVYSDLVGERSVLMGMIQGAFSAQYKVLRHRGHSPSEAYNETVEEALVSLYPLINEKGMDWLYANCSTTAQRGALDWAPRFEQAIRPIIEDCYDSVMTGKETKNVIDANSDKNYREKLNKELETLSNTELWRVGKVIRELRKGS